MQFGKLIEGLQILAKYEDKGLEAYIGGAEHDKICGSAAEINEDAEVELNEDEEEVFVDTRLSTEDHARLIELGWFIDDGYWCCFT